MTQVIRYFSYVLPLLLLLFPVVILFGFFIYRKRRKYLAFKESVVTVIIDVFLCLSIIGILIVTLVPQSIRYIPIEQRVQLMPFADVMNISKYVLIENIGLNILLFLPFGFFTSCRLSLTKILRRIFLLGICFSFFIELLQLLLPIGRSTTVDDIILNTLGAIIGSLLYVLLKRIFPDGLIKTSFVALHKRGKEIRP